MEATEYRVTPAMLDAMTLGQIGLYFEDAQGADKVWTEAEAFAVARRQVEEKNALKRGKRLPNSGTR